MNGCVKILLGVLLCAVSIGCVNRRQPSEMKTDAEIGTDYLRIHRLPDVPVTHTDAYKIRMRQPVYPPETEQLVLDVINVDGPTVYPEYHALQQREEEKWVEFPFRGDISFAGVGRELFKGDTLPEYISADEFQYPFTPNRYRALFYVSAIVCTYFNWTDKGIAPVEGTELDGAIGFKVLASNNDSVRMVFENHTNWDIRSRFVPIVGTEEVYAVHPLCFFDSSVPIPAKEITLKGGEALSISVPAFWNVASVKKEHQQRFASGKLLPGKYKVSLSVHIYMDTEFEISGSFKSSLQYEYELVEPVPFPAKAGKEMGMRTERKTYPAGVKTVDVYVSNPGRQELSFGRRWDLEKWNGREWARPQCWASLLMLKDDQMQTDAPLLCFRFPISEWYYLDAGKYRLVKSINGKEMSAEFTIDDL